MQCLIGLIIFFMLDIIESTQNEHCFDTDVVIIGGGISGMTALNKFLENELRAVRVLEARTEIGGRLWKYQLGNTVVELGANWIHGTKQNPITKLVNDGNISGFADNPTSLICRDFKGENKSMEFITERDRLNEKLKLIMEKGKNSSWIRNQWKKEGLEYTSLRDVLLLEGWKNDTEIKNLAEISVIDFQDAVTPDEVSSRCTFMSNGSVNSLTDTQYFITDQRGYVSILKQLFNEPLEFNSFVELNRTVNKIYWNKHGVRVETVDGHSLTSKLALLTVSVGALKESIKFQPNLPKWKQDAINLHGMTLYTKIFLKFPKRFWDNVEFIYFMHWKRGYFPVWQSLDAENRTQTETNILLMTVTGTEAERIESMKDKDIIMEIMEVLRGVYGRSIPDPINFVIPRWGKDPLFRGSYSFLAPTQTHKSNLDMQANVGPLFFAGEAIHETYPGYLHGAYCQAEAAAYDILYHLRAPSYELRRKKTEYYDNCFRDPCGGCNKY